MPYEVTRNGEVVATYPSYNEASFHLRRQPMRRDGTDIWKIVRISGWAKKERQ